MPATDNSAKAEKAWGHDEIEKLVEAEQRIYETNPNSADTIVRIAEHFFLCTLAAAAFPNPALKLVPLFHKRFLQLRFGTDFNDHNSDMVCFSAEKLSLVFGDFNDLIQKHKAWKASGTSWKAKAFKRAVVFSQYYLTSLDDLDNLSDDKTPSEDINEVEKRRGPFEHAMKYLCERVTAARSKTALAQYLL